MQRQGEHRRVILENRRCAIALMHIQVDHQHLQWPPGAPKPFGLHETGGHRQIVEHTKTAALGHPGMVSAPGQVGGNAL